MPHDGPQLTIRSFRLAFELERRIHKIDRFRLPLPYGLPLRSVAYALAALAVVLVVKALPVAGSLLAFLPWPIVYGVIPVATAQLLTQIQVDGRPAHEAAAAWIRVRFGPRRLVGLTPARARSIERLAPFVIAPDERGVAYRRGVVDGPARVVLRQHATATPRRARLHVASADARPAYRARRVALRRGQRVVFR